MSRTLPPVRPAQTRSTTSAPRRLKRGASLAALGLAVSLAPTAFAQNQPFNTMVGMQAGRVIGPNGQVSQWTGARTPVIGTAQDGRPLMTIEQTEQKALLDWEDFRLKTNEVLEFQQQSADWIAVNRVHGQHASQIDGEIRAIGKVFVFNDNGVLVGKDAQINTRSLVTGTGFADVIVDGSTTTLVQTQQKGKLDWHTTSTAPGVWSNLSVQTGETLRFEQQSPDWFVVNKVVLKNTPEGLIAPGDQSTKINGEIAAAGDVFIFNDKGVVFNADATVDPRRYNSVQVRLKDGRVELGETGAKVNARRLVTGAGFSDVERSGSTTTLVQSKEKSTLDWSNMSFNPGEVLLFRQEEKNWIALNRSYSSAITRMAGDIKALGNIYLVAPQGLSIDGKVEAQQVVLSSLHMRNDQLEDGQKGGLVSFGRNYNDRMDPTFSNTWIYHTGDNEGAPLGRGINASNYYDLMKGGPAISDPNDPLKYNVTIGAGGKVTTAGFGKVILAGPGVTNKGTISVQDEGQVILAAGENIYFTQYTPFGMVDRSGMLTTYVGGYNPMSFQRVNIPYNRPPMMAETEEWRAFYSLLLGREVALGETLDFAEWNSLTASSFSNGQFYPAGLIGRYLDTMQADRALAKGYVARNEGVISAKRGGSVDFRGFNLEQMGVVDMTSTALFRSNVTFRALVSEYREYQGGDADGPLLPGHGHVVFGKGSLTQITPDLDAKDMIPVSSGSQRVGELRVQANSVHMQEDAMVHMPSGKVNIALDAAGHVYNNHIGQGANQGNEDGTRFLMDKGATIDLSGWDVTLEMGYHQVSGRLFAAQLADAPVQQDGPLYRKEITVDRRYGTNVANWESFDNLSQGTLAQFLTTGGTFDLYVGDDFIMKPGSVIDVSGGVTTYKSGYVYTTLLRRLDGSVIDIREADPDELYMGLANEWVVYSPKWGKQKNYYIPLMSSARGKWEESYQHGGAAGSINVLAPDAVLQGTLKGEALTGKYQRANPLKGGLFSLNAHAGNEEGEYVSDNILISAHEDVLNAAFGMRDKLSDVYGDMFGEEFDRETDPVNSDVRHSGNLTLASQDFFNRSTMGDYQLAQRRRVEADVDFPPSDGVAVRVEEGVNLQLQNGASFSIEAEQRMDFLGSIRTEGGNISLSSMSLKFAEGSKLDTRGSWYSDYEVLENVALSSTPRIHGGSINLAGTTDANPQRPSVGDIQFTLPETMVIDTSGGAWVDRDGNIKRGRGGDLSINLTLNPEDKLDLSGMQHARAYGLAGNGKFKLFFGDDIVVGNSLPEMEEGEDAARPPLLFTPDFFVNSGFSAISLTGRHVTIEDGAQVNASAASLQLHQQTLHNGATPAIWTQSGADIYDVADIVQLKPEQRSSDLRRGMDLEFIAYGGAQQLKMGEGSLLSTEVGGHIKLAGNAQIDGTVLAPAGRIEIGGGNDDNTQSYVRIGEKAKLLAPGVSLITWRGLNSEGRELVDGELYNGGSIVLASHEVTLEKGSELNVAGVSATFDLQVANQTGGVARSPFTLESNGGTISIGGARLSLNDAIYKAQAGGLSARGGKLDISWAAATGNPGNGGPVATPEQVADQMEMYAGYGYLMDENFTPLYNTIYGVDLSVVAWEWAIGVQLDLPPGFTINNREELISLLNAITVASSGVPPMFIVGEAMEGISGPPPMPEVDPGFMTVLNIFGGFNPPPAPEGDPIIVHLATEKIGEGGFSSLGLTSSSGIIFNGDVNLGGKKADGRYVFDSILVDTGQIMGREGSKVNLEAGVVSLSSQAGGASGYAESLETYGVSIDNENTSIDVKAGTLLEIGNANFFGFDATNLISAGDIRLAGVAPIGGNDMRPTGALHSTGRLTLKADQIYAGTGRNFTIESDIGIEIKAQDDGGPINESPYEAAARLTLRAPEIVQGGTLRSPLGTLTLDAYNNGEAGSGALIFKAGSLTSVSADGKVVPYGYLSNGDTWIDPFTGLELTTLPSKTLNLTADTVDLQQGATLDVSGGGDLYAREFVPGLNGTRDWLTGYFDYSTDTASKPHADKWKSTPADIYAIVPDYAGNIAPLGFGASQIGVGDRVYLAGGSGLPAGFYTLLPAEYALLPGAYRVTAQHRYGDGLDGARLGEILPLADGSSLQTGYRIDGASGGRDQRTVGFHVMSGKTLRERSLYRETGANSFFSSEAFLKKALRINRPVGEIPRIPLDGGSVVFRVDESLKLNGQLKSSAGKDGRGGFADIASDKVVVAGANTDLTQYDDYLVLNSDQLNGFGAESLLIGGVRRQGDVNLEVNVTGTDVIVDNEGSVLFGPELLFASVGTIDVKDGAKIETRGKIAGSSGDIRIVPSIGQFIDDNNTPWTEADDVLVHGVLDVGAVLRVSSDNQVDILRDAQAVSEATRLRNDPAALALINAARANKGLAPLDLSAGLLRVEDGASIISSASVALDGSNDTLLGDGATLQAKELSAAASRVSIGDVPVGAQGLVFANGALGTLGNASSLTLKSYSSIDLYGGVTLNATGDLRLDATDIRVLDGDDKTTTLQAKTLTFTSSGDGEATATAGAATLNLEAENIRLEGNDKWLSGIDQLNVRATQRVIGAGDSTLYVPGDVSITAGGLTTESGARLFIDADGDINVNSSASTTLPVFQSFGGTLGLRGDAINYAGQTRMTGGTLTLQAREGDVVLGTGSILDVTSNVRQFFDRTVGVGAGSVNLIADNGDVNLGAGSLIDVSGSSAGGEAGTLTLRAGLGEALLNGTIKGTSAAGNRSGSFNLLTQTLSDFAGFNGVLDTGGFRESRRFEINSGDVTVNGMVNVNNFAVVANDGSVSVTGTVRTAGENGGRIQISAAEDVTLTSTAKLLAAATASDGAGGTVIVETTGTNGGAISTQAGSMIDVSGSGEGGRLVRFRAPQVGSDVAIGQLDGDIEGARSVIAEAFRVYQDVETIDQGVIDQVSDDAVDFMAANGGAIRNRLGADVTLVAGIELRSDGDMELTQDWDLSGLRFDGAAGVLTLRASGDLLINGNLTDGFDTAGKLLDEQSWAFNLTAGANTQSPDTLAVLTGGQLAADKGNVVIGGTADTIEYFYDPAYNNDTRLYRTDENGVFLRDPNESNYKLGFFELQRDPLTGKYIDPVTGLAIDVDPVTGDYVDTAYYAKRPLPWIQLEQGGGYEPMRDDGAVPGYVWDYDPVRYQQIDNSTGYYVRTGTGAINVSSAVDLILEQRRSVIYTAGINAPVVDGFYAPDNSQFGVGGGDVTLRIGGDITASDLMPQLPSGYIRRRGSLNIANGLFAPVVDRDFDQTTWWVDYSNFQGGIGALGGGNIDIEAQGDVFNLGVAIPNSARVSGNTTFLAGGLRTPTTLHETGGGDLAMKVGGNLEGGVFYVANGTGDMTVGGSVTAGAKAIAAPTGGQYYTRNGEWYAHPDFRKDEVSWDMYAALFTSSGQFNITSGGDLAIEGVMDPLLIEGGSDTNRQFISYTDEASVDLFSAGGDVILTGNGLNLSILDVNSGSVRRNYYGSDYGGAFRGGDSIAWDLRPAHMTAVAAAGDVKVLGGITMLPSATGSLELLAGQNVLIGTGTEAVDPFANNLGIWEDYATKRSGTGYEGIIMSQSDLSLFNTSTNHKVSGTRGVGRIHFLHAGPGDSYPGVAPWSQDNKPVLHVGDTEPVRIYAAGGDIITSASALASAELIIPKQLWLQAEGNVYFPSYSIQHNNPNDVSIIRAGEGIYFTPNYTLQNSGQGTVSGNFGRIYLAGPGRLEVEAGTDLWIPSNASGIVTERVKIYERAWASNGSPGAMTDMNPDEKGADIAISVGYNQDPSYAAFEEAYLDPSKVGEMADYLLDEETGKSLYLFDRDYKRADGATGEFAVPEPREGLVNYVRRLQGLQPLETRAEEVAYLDQAWTFWQTLSSDYKTPFYRSVLFLELRTTGREANDPENDRYNTTFRGYNAIKTLFPGAQKNKDEALSAGESRWQGDFETYASRVMSFGGGKIEFVIPGGDLTLANVAARPGETGQPDQAKPRGDAFRAGVVTADGGEVNILSHGSVTVNESRILTSKGGNVLIWSSWGDIAAGKGAKTSLSPQFYDYQLDNWARMERKPAGLPTGAGIGTLATQDGTPPADVDLIAPAGVVDAGDAGIRVSGNFNVFAVQILGTDNIEVAGVSTGLPVPPAAPPTSLDVDVSSRDDVVNEALKNAVAQVQKNNEIISPSLIEVQVTGYEDEEVCGSENNPCPEGQGPQESTPVASFTPQAPHQVNIQYSDDPIEFSIPSQMLDDAVRAVGKASGMTIIFDAAVIRDRQVPAVNGRMTAREALKRLLNDEGLSAVRVGQNAVVLKKT